MLKCSSCGKPLLSVNHVETKISIRGKLYPAIAYACPMCFAAVSVGFDPFSIKDDIVRETAQAVAAALKRG